jgi:hypothetical protein
MTLTETLEKWTITLANDSSYIKTLADQMKKENKLLALRNVHLNSKYSKYAEVLLGLENKSGSAYEIAQHIANIDAEKLGNLTKAFVLPGSNKAFENVVKNSGDEAETEYL